MQKLTRADLLTLEAYHEQRAALRAKVLAHKARRKVFIGAHAGLYFEDRLTVQYQIQEMLRVEKIFVGSAIQEELDAYNPLIPDGDNLKATFMLEYEDVVERRAALETLRGIEREVWLEVDGQPRVMGIADEDLERTDETKTSAVHFLRFQLPAATAAAFKAGATVRMGIEHPAYRHALTLPEETRTALAADLD
ncbi:MAG: DUF3501 family protein [Gammaproteobacteria bacterium]|nr:DUF3501 family protein [Gammaproteobacteria bacterium]